jgi:hypothetical protein
MRSGREIRANKNTQRQHNVSGAQKKRIKNLLCSIFLPHSPLGNIAPIDGIKFS